MTAEHAGEIMWAYTSPELYELLVFNRRWPPERYGAFIADAMIAALLPPGSRRPGAPLSLIPHPALVGDRASPVTGVKGLQEHGEERRDAGGDSPDR